MSHHFYAHSLEGKLPPEWQLLESHLEAVAKTAEKSAAIFQSGDWAWNAGWLHDLGKVADEFQAYLLRENGLDDWEYDVNGHGRVNHSSAGTAFVEEKLGSVIGRALAYLVAGHHAGLPDFYPTDAGKAALRIRLMEGQKDLNRIRSVAQEFVKQIRQVSRPPSFVKAESYHLWVRILFSCLVDADFLNTEFFMNPAQAKEREGFGRLTELKALFDKHMHKMAAEAPVTCDVNSGHE